MDKYFYMVVFLLGIDLSVNGHILLNAKEANGDCSQINIITRAEWRARPPKQVVNLTLPVPEFFVHHTDTRECFDKENCSSAVRSIQAFHMDTRGWNDIGYNFLVGEDGNVYEGRGWDHRGAQVKGYNSISLGASVIGDYTSKIPNEKALWALQLLIGCSVEKEKLNSNYRLYGHRDAGNTSCPGNALYGLIQKWPHYSHDPPVPFQLK